jgi:hypothetical protein
VIGQPVFAAHTATVDVEWDVTDATKLERDTAESGISEELVGAKRSFHRPRAVLVFVAVACLIGLAGVVVLSHHPRSPRSAIAASVTAASSQSGAHGSIRGVVVDAWSSG